MSGSGNGELAAPANRIDMRAQLWNGERIAPVILNVVLGEGSDGTAGPIGSGEELCQKTFAVVEDGTRNWYVRALGERRTLRVVDLRGTKLSGKTVDRLNGVVGNSIVVAFDGRKQIGCGTNYGDVRRCVSERQGAIVLQQNDSFFCSLERDGAICGRVVRVERYGVELVSSRRIEDAELKAGSIEALG